MTSKRKQERKDKQTAYLASRGVTPPGTRQEEPTAHEETRARQTGATVEQLRKETHEARIAELQASISKQIAELYELVEPTTEECNDFAEQCHDDRGSTAEDMAEDRMAQIEHALWLRNPENWDEETQCGTCGKLVVDDAVFQAVDCLTKDCGKTFCSGECYDKHTASTGHDS